MKKIKKVLLWALSIFCVLSGLVYLPSFASIIFLAAGMASMPIRPICNLWKKVPLKQLLKPMIIVTLFIWGVCAAPTEKQPDTDVVASVQEYEPESTIENKVQGNSKAVDTEKTVEVIPATQEKDEPSESVSEAGSTNCTLESAESIESVPQEESPVVEDTSIEETSVVSFDLSSVPAYSGTPYAVVNDNVPFFNKEEMEAATTSYEKYAPLDAMGRCGVCVASVGIDIMPTEERGEIGPVKPSGWNQKKYPGIVDGNYLYNRCHLIGYQLTGENANTQNLITGTRSLNVDGMLPFENMVADYVKETGNHVLYRVTPVFENENPLASGVLMEGKSVEDGGEGILFCVYCYNAQPGIFIDYTDGASVLVEGTVQESSIPDSSNQQTVPEEADQQSQEIQEQSRGNYAVNSKNGKIHIVDVCAATGTGDNAMKSPVYFDTYEEAEKYSIQVAPNQKKRKCGNCW